MFRRNMGKSVKQEGQGHWIKVKVIHWKMLFGYLDISLTWFYMSKVKVTNQVKVTSKSDHSKVKL